MNLTATTAFQRHNHQHCMANAMEQAKDVCREKGVRLTPLRQQVLEILWRSHKPLGAYALMDILADTQGGQDNQKAVAPPTVYRALDFLAQHNLAHRLASLNAYIGCSNPGAAHSSHFFICATCENTVEILSQPVSDAIGHCAEDAGFQVQGEMVEVRGLCPRCQP
jgi:Fur family zinc uptake transcriptional regulator